MNKQDCPYSFKDQQSLDNWMVSDSNLSNIQNIITSCKKNPFLYKFISANDAGSTGSHQSGFYLPNSSWPIFFDSPGMKGKNKDQPVTIQWESDDIETKSRCIWYGEGTRREYRLTRFGRGFPYLKDEHIGSLVILIKTGKAEFSGWVLDSDNDIEIFLAEFDISHMDTGGIKNIDTTGPVTFIPKTDKNRLFADFIGGLGTAFPETAELSDISRKICNVTGVPSDPDDRLVKWLDTEYELFRLIENKIYQPYINQGGHNLDEIIEFAGSVLNRRKSRAGKSLEHHLAAIFDERKIPYSHGGTTEGKSRPDFIFPGIAEYHNPKFREEGLVFLGSKTTCKDRWRQILNEADRIDKKHLFTLQQGISSNQLGEMERANVQLVIPHCNLKSFPESWRARLQTLGPFVEYVRKTTA
jgi:type II restriction enzyme